MTDAIDQPDDVSNSYDTPEEYSSYRWHFTRKQISDLLHYGHIIPISKGFTTEYVSKNHPGWTWNELIAVIRAAGVHEVQPGGMWCCQARVKCLHFNDATSFSVEFEPGSEPRTEPRPKSKVASLRNKQEQ